MKLIISLLLLYTSYLAAGEILKITGTYKNQNLIITNPYIKAQKTYSITSIVLNEKELKTELKQHTVEIHLEEQNLRPGTTLNFKIYYQTGFKPEVVNLFAIKENTLFKYNEIIIEERSIKIRTRGEMPKSNISIQRFENNEWVVVKNQKCIGQKSSNYYDIPVEHLSGTTQIKIKYNQEDGYSESSPIKTYKSSKVPINFYPTKVKDKITFLNNNKKPVSWVIYDIKGQKIQAGKGTVIDCTKLKVKEIYKLSFDNQKKAFQKLKNK